MPFARHFLWRVEAGGGTLIYKGDPGASANRDFEAPSPGPVPVVFRPPFCRPIPGNWPRSPGRGGCSCFAPLEGSRLFSLPNKIPRLGRGRSRLPEDPRWRPRGDFERSKEYAFHGRSGWISTGIGHENSIPGGSFAWTNRPGGFSFAAQEQRPFGGKGFFPRV